MKEEHRFLEKRLRFLAAQMDAYDDIDAEPPAELAEEWRESAWHFTKEKMRLIQEAEDRTRSEAC